MRPSNPVRILVLIILASLAAALFAAEKTQSPLEAALELFFAPDIPTVESFLLKSTREQLRRLDPNTRGEFLGFFMTASNLEKDGFTIERMEKRPQLLRIQKAESKETITVTLEKQQVEEDRAILQVVARGKDFPELRLVIRMQSEEGRWRLAGITNPTGDPTWPFERLDDPDLGTKLLEQKRMAYEASALDFLRAYYAALQRYDFDHNSYPETLAALASGPQDCPTCPPYIDERLASGKLSGYVFIYKFRSPSSYTLEARPENSGKTGNRFLFIDQTGTIHYEEGKPAGPESPEIGKGPGPEFSEIGKPAGPESSLLPQPSAEMLPSAYETAALANLRHYQTLLHWYLEIRAVYPETLADLVSRPIPIPLLVTIEDVKRLATGKAGGYVFIYKSKLAGFKRGSYTLEARPEIPGKSGNRFFFMDQTGTIHYEEAKPAGPESPLLPRLDSQSRTPAANQQQQIESALGRLLNRTNSDAFLIVEHRPSGKLIQFAGSPTGPLLLDLPVQALNEKELERAKLLFAEFGVSLQQSELYDQPGGSLVGRQTGFQVQFDRDIVAASSLASRIFREVYLLPTNTPLTMEEN